MQMVHEQPADAVAQCFRMHVVQLQAQRAPRQSQGRCKFVHILSNSATNYTLARYSSLQGVLQVLSAAEPVNVGSAGAAAQTM